jgi:FkbM family methyltransferase
MIYLIKITELLKLFFALKGYRKIFFKGNVSLSSIQIAYSFKRQIKEEINLLIDVGANEGQFALTWNHFFPQTRIVSFEPVPDTYKKLQQKIAGREKIQAINVALGSTAGQQKIHKNMHSHASSFLQVSDYQKDIIPRTVTDSLEEVTVSTLDNYMQEFGDFSNAILKLDVQGFEKEVILGGGKMLEKINYLIIELSFIPMYKNEMLFSEMNCFLEERGFEAVAPIGFLQDSYLQIPQIDFLYRRKAKR